MRKGGVKARGKVEEIAGGPAGNQSTGGTARKRSN
jgi:hypothetical protein